jgi:ketosteroid isomerase-like protein
MKRLTIFSVALASVCLMAIEACNTKASSEKPVEQNRDTLDVAAMKKIVEESNLAYDKAFVDGDSIAVMDHFTDDIVLLAPGVEQLVGKKAIAPMISQFLKLGIKKFTDETTRVLGAGEYIIEEGNYFLGGANGSTIDKGKYICVWKKVNGQWRVCSNMFSTNLPAETAKK